MSCKDWSVFARMYKSSFCGFFWGLVVWFVLRTHRFLSIRLLMSLWNIDSNLQRRPKQQSSLLLVLLSGSQLPALNSPSRMFCILPPPPSGNNLIGSKAQASEQVIEKEKREREERGRKRENLSGIYRGEHRFCWVKSRYAHGNQGELSG